jgi:hypothetical protein
MPSVLAVEAIQVGPRNLRRLGKSQHEDYAIAAVGVSVFALLSIAWSRAVFHWFLMPVGACGILAGVDVVRWLRGRLDVFDPKTVVGCLAFYGFFAAPILHVIWDIYGVGNEMLLWGDWRPWLGAMASLNALGLVAYRCAHNWMFNRAAPSSIRWNLDRKKFYPVFASALAASVIGVAIYLWELGGISGVVDAYENNPEAFVGKGWLLVLAWPLAVLSFIVIVHAWTDRHKTHRPRLATGIIFLSISGIGHFLLLGWYGSRGTTIWALFWMAGIVHYHFRKLSRGIVTVGLILLVVFMYFYGFYKEQKRESFEILRSPALWWEPPGYQRDLKHLLLGDLARADSNALILHNLIKDPGDYDYRWGLTYLGAFGILIPRNIWTDRPEFKVDAGTEAQQGKATPWRSSQVYGLSGEALLNFGPLGIVPMFAIFGAVLGWYRRKLTSWDPLDARMFLAPFFTILFATGLTGDSDNLVFAAVMEGTLVTAAVFAASRIYPIAILARTNESPRRSRTPL